MIRWCIEGTQFIVNSRAISGIVIGLRTRSNIIFKNLDCSHVAIQSFFNSHSEPYTHFQIFSICYNIFYSPELSGAIIGSCFAITEVVRQPPWLGGGVEPKPQLFPLRPATEFHPNQAGLSSRLLPVCPKFSGALRGGWWVKSTAFPPSRMSSASNLHSVQAGFSFFARSCLMNINKVPPRNFFL